MKCTAGGNISSSREFAKLNDGFFETFISFLANSFLDNFIKLLPIFLGITSPLRKVVIEGVACSPHLARKSRAQILAVWFQTDLQPVKQNLYLAPDQILVRPKKIANDLKINLAP